MSETTEAAKEAAKKESAEVTVDQPLNVEEMVKRLPKLTEGLELTGEYYQFEESEVVRCYFVGLTKIGSRFDAANPSPNGEEVKIPAVRLLFDDGSFKICASAMLVGVLSEFTPPMAVQIVKTGTETSPKGDYGTFKVHPLV